MDDTVFLESSKFRMQKIVDIANEFYLINDIDINTKKSKMIIINLTVERHEQTIELGQDHSTVQATNDEIRYLGVWFSNKPNRRRWMQRLSVTIKNFCDTVRRKFVPAGQLMKLVKNWMKLPKNTPSSLLFHEGCLAISTHIRLRDAQLKSLITDPIFDLIAKALDISMVMDLIDRSTWSVSGGKELLLKGIYLMTWKQYRRLVLLLVQGRVARWYRDVAHLCTFRIDNMTIIDDMEIAEANHWTFLLNIIPDARHK
ncbi:hypothetical protein C1646_758003 [Rhizophagus diaphanus]|nr:hypothetical protein C1646_758003 [Rhizophagus diaphanus] [Rhizophagus sp. MUCL 43196]